MIELREKDDKMPCDYCIHHEVCLYKEKYTNLISQLRNKFNEFKSSDENGILKNFDFSNPTCNFKKINQVTMRER